MDQEFDKYAADYDEHMQELLGDHKYYTYQKVSTLRQNGLLKSGMRILDYGCGTGTLASEIVRSGLGATVDGFDPSEDSLKRVADDVRAQGAFTTDGTQLGRDYDLVVFSNVMHHVEPTERDAVLADARSRLAPTGHIAIIEHNPLNPMTRKIVRDCPFDENAILLPSGEAKDRLSRLFGGPANVRFTLFFPASLKSLMGLEKFLGWCPLGAQYLAFAGQR
ncbi:class I SAM-dependent methyltransferase [Rhodospirillaceae bacterium KN72]|uniref:Class I SAM-dependent methyltransferase n=1 Tax=Pacificispira spongiicola TaxID=2729598 RepID=A0A7Y0DWP8_9PROT|nr:class I SAM-dependent methyltransferase [Pacificispira spongiicola]NMM42903.1 class I SAM-dependent methyltransferase [Pacificispira spongiicola]